ncbi:AI-2E family transporter, partial [Enterobacter intestinihominis]
MTASPPDKAGLHILLKLACLVVILAGIHAAADIIVQLLLALFFAIVLNPLVTWFLRRGISRPVAITIVVMVMLVVLTALFGVLADAPRDKCAHFREINGIAAAFQYWQ